MSDLFETKGIPGQPGELYPVGQRPDPEPPVELNEFGQRAATDEEQATYEQLVTRAQQYIIGNAPALVSQMNNDQRPVYQNVGRLGLQIVEMVNGLAASAGEELEMDMLEAGGEEIAEMLMELGDSAGIFPFKSDSDDYDEQLGMAFAYGHELKARELIEKGDPEVRESYENVLATNIARETQEGKGPPPEFFDSLERAKTEGPRRLMHGVD